MIVFICGIFVQLLLISLLFSSRFVCFWLHVSLDLHSFVKVSKQIKWNEMKYILYISKFTDNICHTAVYIRIKVGAATIKQYLLRFGCSVIPVVFFLFCFVSVTYFKQSQGIKWFVYSNWKWWRWQQRDC